jgi:hypothetical protein
METDVLLFPGLNLGGDETAKGSDDVAGAKGWQKLESKVERFH